MKTMTATALLSAGAVTPQTPVACPGTTTVDGREFENEDQFDLGTVSFTEAFAQSCNTTFIQAALELPDPALAEAAASYGVGTEWQLPVGIFGGSVPSDATGTTKAADAIGQGQVLMSPAQMALVAAGIASGTPAAPVEVVGAEPAGPAPAGPGQPVLDALRPMMRQVVLTGTATRAGRPRRGLRQDRHRRVRRRDAAAGPRLVHGLPRRAAPPGDIAFAVLVEGGGSSSVAVGVTDTFLGALG